MNSHGQKPEGFFVSPFDGWDITWQGLSDNENRELKLP